MQLASPPTIQFNCTTRLLKDPSLSKVRMIVFAMRYEQEMAVKTFKRGSLGNMAFFMDHGEVEFNIQCCQVHGCGFWLAFSVGTLCQAASSSKQMYEELRYTDYRQPGRGIGILGLLPHDPQ